MRATCLQSEGSAAFRPKAPPVPHILPPASCLLPPSPHPCRWRKAVDLAKADKLYKDAMETTAQSGEQELAEDLLRCGAGGGGEVWAVRGGVGGRSCAQVPS